MDAIPMQVNSYTTFQMQYVSRREKVGGIFFSLPKYLFKFIYFLYIISPQECFM